MFCDDCGKKILRGSLFCDSCGRAAITNSPVSTSTEKAALTSNQFVFALLIIAVGFVGYRLYISLEQTKNELSTLRESTRTLISAQQKLIDDQGQKISLNEAELEKAKQSETLLRQTVSKLQTNQTANIQSQNNASVSWLSPSVVKLICVSSTHSDSVQFGSGALFKTKRTDMGPYYIQTNLHVVQTDDGSTSRCLVVLYPNSTDSNIYLLFKAEGYRYFQSGFDVAFIKPELITSDRAGTTNDLNIYAIADTSLSPCTSVNAGDNVTILGYPGSGGNTLTITKGIVSGFEIQQGVKYIKTDAKIDHGNSGGLAVHQSGCMLGIPTFVQKNVESIGRILDLNYLYNEILR